MAFASKSLFGTAGISSTSSQVSTGGCKEVEVMGAPDDSVSCLRFSPACCPSILLLAGSWDKTVRVWEISSDGVATPRLCSTTQAPILDACWNQEGTQAFVCGVDKAAYSWDFATNTMTQVAVHDAPIRTIHFINSPTYTCIMTGGWDKKLKFWDLRSNVPMKVIDLSDRVYCADVHYPMAVVATGDRFITVLNLEREPTEFKRIESQLKYQSRCISIFLDKNSSSPAGFALGSIEGRVGIQCIASQSQKDTFTFKCHRSQVTSTNTQEIYAVNDVSFNPFHQTLVTVGSDGKYTFWDKDARTKLKGSESMEQQSITACTISAKGNIFAYAFGYDWSKGHEYNDPNKKPRIFIRECFEDMKPQTKK